MSPVLKALSSSVGKKFVMGITGLLLCGFLVTHVAGNLLLYAGADAYNKYAHALHSQPALLLVAEIILYFLFIVHIYLAFHTTTENWSARGHGYAVKRSKLDAAPHTTSWPLHPEAWMFWSGAVILAFLIVHVGQFAWEIWLPGPPGEQPFTKAIRILNDNVTAFIYLVGVFFLGIHLWHGFAAAFQSLGITHPRYAGLIKWFGVLFAVVIGLGFASFVVFARLSPKANVQSPKSSQSEQVSSLTLEFATVSGATGGGFGPPVSSAHEPATSHHIAVRLPSFCHATWGRPCLERPAAFALAAQSCRQWHPASAVVFRPWTLDLGPIHQDKKS